jgi:TRAP-type C4-dicarboxylate transport system permease small subunit|tara:strand:+ start:545 stop:1036 length:492 start_codon:yes stop_codon:yes gene_type:complete
MKFKIDKIFDYSASASGLVLLALAVLTFCDVFGRRFLNSPVTGTIELVEIGMALVAFLAMPRAFFLNANVSADFINNLNLGKFKIFLVIIKFILMMFIMSLMAYATTLTSYKFMNNQRVTLDLELYFYPFYFICSIGMWISVIAILVWFIKTISEIKFNSKKI